MDWVYMAQRLELNKFSIKLVGGRVSLPAPTDVGVSAVCQIL